jgi:hypothetical protein
MSLDEPNQSNTATVLGAKLLQYFSRLETINRFDSFGYESFRGLKAVEIGGELRVSRIWGDHDAVPFSELFFRNHFILLEKV